MKSHPAFYTLGALAVVAIAAFIGSQRVSAHEEDQRVFELRTYHASEGKMDELQARFRDHTCELFVRHGMKLIGFWTTTDGDDAGQVLVYMLAHDSRDAAQASWNAFKDDPEWQAVYKESQANGSLTSKVESVFLKSTDYSPIQ